MALITPILCLLAVLLPASRPFLFPENRLVENATALFYIATFILALWTARKTKQHRITYILIAFLGLFFFLEEIDYGGTLFSRQYDHAYGLELSSVHNVSEWPYFFLKAKSILALDAALIVFGFVIIIITILLYKHRALINTLFQKNPQTRFIFICGILLTGAFVLDAGLAYNHYMPYIEELLELNASLALLFGSWPTTHSEV